MFRRIDLTKYKYNKLIHKIFNILYILLRYNIIYLLQKSTIVQDRSKQIDNDTIYQSGIKGVILGK